MASDDLAWAVEEACLNAWPAPRQVLVGPWLARLAGGASRRSNSLNPLRAPAYDIRPVLADCAALYRAAGRALLVRVPALARGLDDTLDAAGFASSSEEVCTLWAGLEQVGAAPDPLVTLEPAPDAAWLALRSTMTGHDPATDRSFQEAIGGLALPRAFAALRTEDGAMAQAFGVVHRRLLVLEAVGTAPQARGRGFARRMLGPLLDWGRGQGAEAACLQVVADNTPARALYRSLGFHTELYRYGYRQLP